MLACYSAEDTWHCAHLAWLYERKENKREVLEGDVRALIKGSNSFAVDLHTQKNLIKEHFSYRPVSGSWHQDKQKEKQFYNTKEYGDCTSFHNGKHRTSK